MITTNIFTLINTTKKMGYFNSEKTYFSFCCLFRFHEISQQDIVLNMSYLISGHDFFFFFVPKILISVASGFKIKIIKHFSAMFFQELSSWNIFYFRMSIAFFKYFQKNSQFYFLKKNCKKQTQQTFKCLHENIFFSWGKIWGRYDACKKVCLVLNRQHAENKYMKDNL